MLDTRRKDGQLRVVVTGMSVISPIGIGLDAYWKGLSSGISGIRRIQSFDPSHLTVQIAGEVTDFQPEQFLSRKEQRMVERSSQFAITATHMAMQDAHLDDETLQQNSERIAVLMGTALGGADVLHQNIQRFQEGKRFSPSALVSSLTNMPAFYVARTVHATGYNSAVTTACAAGTQSIGAGAELIRRGRADIVFAGGTEALITDYIVAAFDSMTSLARGYNDNPEAASRPFDAERDGFVYSEGCGILVMESMEHALQRGSQIHGEILGYATANDAYHITSIDPEGKGARRSMHWAINDAHIDPADVHYINAHGTGTKSNDRIETAAIKAIFGKSVPVSSTKSMTGHSLAAAGALEAVASILALQNECLPPTINYQTPDPDCDLDYIPNESRSAAAQVALSNSFGLGGHNATLVMGRV